MIQSAEYTLDKIEEVWRYWKEDINSWRSYTAMTKIHEILSDVEKELLKDQGCEPVSKSPTCMGLDDTVPADVSPLCEAKHTGFDAHKAIMCEHEPAAWCRLRGIWVCRKCCQLCYEDMYPEGCMEAEDIWRTRLKSPTPL